MRARLGSRELLATQRIRERGDLLREEEALAAMQLRPDAALGELDAPGPFRARPEPEAARARLVRRLVARGEEARQRRVLREREHPAFDEEGLGLLERLERAVRRQATVMQPLLSQLGEG